MTKKYKIMLSLNILLMYLIIMGLGLTISSVIRSLENGGSPYSISFVNNTKVELYGPARDLDIKVRAIKGNISIKIFGLFNKTLYDEKIFVNKIIRLSWIERGKYLFVFRCYSSDLVCQVSMDVYIHGIEWDSLVVGTVLTTISSTLYFLSKKVFGRFEHYAD